jgi:uncharacterized membrane protein (UPF0127 family)
MRRRWVLLAALLSAGTALAQNETDETTATTPDNAYDQPLDVAFERDVLIIEASEHACYRFDVYLALEYEQQRRGLMHVRDLPLTAGMLFVYEDNSHHAMWMKNTYISLDIAFVRADGSIANIARNTEPLSLRSIRSAQPVTYVLELNAGVTERLAIDTNSRLLWGPTLEFSANLNKMRSTSP